MKCLIQPAFMYSIPHLGTEKYWGSKVSSIRQTEPGQWSGPMLWPLGHRPRITSLLQKTINTVLKYKKNVTSLSSAALQQFFLLFFASASPSLCKQQGENQFCTKMNTGNKLYSRNTLLSCRAITYNLQLLLHQGLTFVHKNPFDKECLNEPNLSKAEKNTCITRLNESYVSICAFNLSTCFWCCFIILSVCASASVPSLVMFSTSFFYQIERTNVRRKLTY